MNYDGTLSPLGFCAADMIKMDHGPTADVPEWFLVPVQRTED